MYLLSTIKRFNGKEITEDKLNRLYAHNSLVSYVKGRNSEHHFVFSNDTQVTVICKGSVRG